MTMGWTSSHLWEFDVDGRCYGDPSFREFDDEPRVYGASGLTLCALIASGVRRFSYVYDLGDNWRHDVTVEEIGDGEPGMGYPAFVDGAWDIPPSWMERGAVRRKTSAVRTGSWISWRRSSTRRMSGTRT